MPITAAGPTAADTHRVLHVSAIVLAALAMLGSTYATGARTNDRGVRVVHASIPMPDGVRLAADLYMPADLRSGERVPALLEHSLRTCTTCGQPARDLCATCASFCCTANFTDCDVNRGNLIPRGC